MCWCALSATGTEMPVWPVKTTPLISGNRDRPSLKVDSRRSVRCRSFGAIDFVGVRRQGRLMPFELDVIVGIEDQIVDVRSDFVNFGRRLVVLLDSHGTSRPQA